MVRAVLVAAALAAAAFVGSSTAARGGCFPDCYPVGDFAPEWSADGSAIGFLRGPASARVADAGRVGSTGRGLETTPSAGNVLSSPDLALLAFTAAGGDGEEHVFVAPFAGGERRTIADLPVGLGSLLDWSSDGSLVAYQWGGDLFAARADGSGSSLLTAGASPSAASWSPDGSQLAYVDRRALWIVGLGGSPPHELVDAADGVRPAWSPDGRLVAFVRYEVPAPGPIRGEELDVVDVSTGAVQRLAGGAVPTYGTLRFAAETDIVWAPAGSRLVYTAMPPTGGLPTSLTWDTDYDLRSVGADGTRDVRIARGQDPAFSAHGSRLAYSAFGPCDGSGIYVAGPTGSNPRRLTAGCTVRGTARADVINGTDRSEEIVGLGGDDRLSGGAGHDWLFGGPGNDTLEGDLGTDSIWAGPGQDTISGGPGRDTIYAADGSPDTISCGTNVQRGSVEQDEVFADLTDAVARDCEVVHGARARVAVTTPARLRITVWPKGRDAGAAIVRMIRCDPTGGTIHRPAAACRRLSSLDRPFAPVPRDVACSQIYGGPQEALVTGTFGGRKVWARFNRRDGCQTDRWSRHAFLFAA